MVLMQIRSLLHRLRLTLRKRVVSILFKTNKVIESIDEQDSPGADRFIKIRPGYHTSLSLSPEISSEVNQYIAREAYLYVKDLWYCELPGGYIWTDHTTNIAVLNRHRDLLGPVSFSYVKENGGQYIHGMGFQNRFLNEGPSAFPVRLNGTVMSLLSGGGRNINFYHWHMDILSRLFYASKFIDLSEVDYFLLPEINQDFQLKTLELIGIPAEKILNRYNIRFYKAERLIALSHPRTATFEAPADLVAGLRTILKLDSVKQNLTTETSNKSVYLSRAKAGRRTVLNEKQVVSLVDKYGYEVVYLEDMTFTETVNFFQNVGNVISPHGAGILNTLYSSYFRNLVELFPFHFVNPYYEKYTHSMNANYYYVRGLDSGEPVPTTRYEAQNHDLMVDLNKLEKILIDIAS